MDAREQSHPYHGPARRRRGAFIAAAPSLLRPAEQQLRRRLEAQPANVDLLRRLADTQRMLGQLEAARSNYRRLLGLAPDPTVDWLVDVLGTEPLPTPPEGQRAVPFARFTDFLSAEERDWLLAETAAAPQCFVPARIGDSEVFPDYRLAFVAESPLDRAIRRWFDPKLRAALPSTLTRLASDSRGLRQDRVADFGFETSVTMHQAGGLYQGHKDARDTGIRAHRRLSFVLYYGREPRRFEGGDLLLHDTTYEEGLDEEVGTYTRFAPLANSLVIFPSDSAHEVTRIVSATGEPLDFADCRFTVNGWIYAHHPFWRPPEQPTDA